MTKPPPPRLDWDKEMVRRLWLHTGLTQEQFADQLGSQKITVQKWLKGENPLTGTVRRLLDYVAERVGFEA